MILLLLLLLLLLLKRFTRFINILHWIFLPFISIYILDKARVPHINSVVFFFATNAIVTFRYSYSTIQLLIINPIFEDEINPYNLNLVNLCMHWQIYSFSCLYEVKECMWDFRSSGMLGGVTSQKSEDLIYNMTEAWKHANST
jgi:hypothetical protein